MAEFMADNFPKRELLEAFKAAGDPRPARTSKGDLVLAYYELPRGPRAAARQYLADVEAAKADVQPDSETPASKGAAKPESGLELPKSGSGKVRVVVNGRGRYGQSWKIADGVMQLTREGSGKVEEIPVSDIETVETFA